MASVLRDKYKAAGGLQIPSKLVAKRISSNLFDQNLVHTSEGNEPPNLFARTLPPLNSTIFLFLLG